MYQLNGARGSMSVIAVCNFWKCTTLIVNACLHLIFKEKNKRVSIEVLDYQLTFRISPIRQLGFYREKLYRL